MTERSFQAQLLIPMAASLAFGLMLATAPGAVAGANVLLAVPQLHRDARILPGRSRTSMPNPRRSCHESDGPDANATGTSTLATDQSSSIISSVMFRFVLTFCTSS